MFTVTVTGQADARTPEVPGGRVNRHGGGGRGKERAMRSVPARGDTASPGDTTGPDCPQPLPEPSRRRRRSPGRAGRERGTITLMLLVMFVALLALAGIVIDGGAKL